MNQKAEEDSLFFFFLIHCSCSAWCILLHPDAFLFLLQYSRSSWFALFVLLLDLFFLFFVFMIHSRSSFFPCVASINWNSPTVRFTDRSAFTGLSFSSLWLESDNKTFVLENRILIDLRWHGLKKSFTVENTIKPLWWHDFRIWSGTCFSLLSNSSPISKWILAGMREHAYVSPHREKQDKQMNDVIFRKFLIIFRWSDIVKMRTRMMQFFLLRKLPEFRSYQEETLILWISQSWLRPPFNQPFLISAAGYEVQRRTKSFIDDTKWLAISVYFPFSSSFTAPVLQAILRGWLPEKWPRATVPGFSVRLVPLNLQSAVSHYLIALRTEKCWISIRWCINSIRIFVDVPEWRTHNSAFLYNPRVSKRLLDIVTRVCFWATDSLWGTHLQCLILYPILLTKWYRIVVVGINILFASCRSDAKGCSLRACRIAWSIEPQLPISAFSSADSQDCGKLRFRKYLVIVEYPTVPCPRTSLISAWISCAPRRFMAR